MGKEKELFNHQKAMAAEYLTEVKEKSQRLGSEWEQFKLGHIKNLTEFQSSITKQKADFKKKLGSMEHLNLEREPTIKEKDILIKEGEIGFS
jgi:hypothetical protein